MPDGKGLTRRHGDPRKHRVPAVIRLNCVRFNFGVMSRFANVSHAREEVPWGPIEVPGELDVQDFGPVYYS